MANVTFTIFAANGTTPVYVLPCVFQANYPYSAKKLIEHESVRAKGSIIVDAGEESWDLNIKGVIMAADYAALMTIVDAIETAIVINTSYYIKIVSGSSTYSYKVKRIQPIIWDEASLRTNFTEYAMTFRVNCW
jgi:hypothetical protein